MRSPVCETPSRRNHSSGGTILVTQYSQAGKAKQAVRFVAQCVGVPSFRKQRGVLDSCAQELTNRFLGGLSQFDGNIVHLTHTDLDAVCCDALFKRKIWKCVYDLFVSTRYSTYLELLAQAEKNGDLTLCLSDLGGEQALLKLLHGWKKKGWRIEWRDHHVWE